MEWKTFNWTARILQRLKFSHHKTYLFLLQWCENFNRGQNAFMQYLDRCGWLTRRTRHPLHSNSPKQISWLLQLSKYMQISLCFNHLVERWWQWVDSFDSFRSKWFPITITPPAGHVQQCLISHSTAIRAACESECDSQITYQLFWSIRHEWGYQEADNIYI